MEKVVGIDVSKDWLDVHILPSCEALRLSNDHVGLEELARHLGALAPDLVALEATGGFETLAAAALSAAGFAVLVVNPAQVRAFASALGKRAKTDPIDAAVIAAFIIAVRPQIRPLADEQTRIFSELVARRRQIIQMIVAERNRERMAVIKSAQKSIKRILIALEKELASLDAEMDDHIRKSPVWQSRESY